MRNRNLLVGLFAVASLACWASHSQCEPIAPDELAKVKAAEAARVAAIDKVYGSVVAIYGNNRQGGGSGVVYDPAGYALTNYHVVAGAGKEGWGGLADKKLYRWKLIGMDPGGDVAIIKLTGKDAFPAATIGNSDRVRVGDFTMAMGNPFILAEDQRPTVTLGVVSGIHRFQHGQSLTMLVYGDCIQVDSSINPGNSGGPLFNMHSEVVGINGRGSFKERGRVNVGVGYAIGSEQVKNFIPELLATKLALHGTLDAVFGDREEGVVCEQLNLDGDLAKIGVELGDRLVSFDGRQVTSAHDFTNWVSTIPAGWPVEVTYERGGVKKTVWLRLPKLPYGQNPTAQPKRKLPKLPPGGRKPKPKDGKPAPQDGKPQPKDGDPKPEMPETEEEPPVEMPKMEPGKIADLEQNRVECRRVIEQYVSQIGGDAVRKAKGFRFAGDVMKNDAKTGKYELLVATDGRWRTSFMLDGKAAELGYDGQRYWRRGDATAAATPLPAEDLRTEPFALDAIGLAGSFRPDTIAKFSHYELQGSDRAQRQRAMRLRARFSADADLFWWFSFLDDAGRFHYRLLKAAVGEDEQDSPLAVTYHDWRAVGGVQLPHIRKVVHGLAEVVQFELTTNECAPLAEISDAPFRGEKP